MSAKCFLTNKLRYEIDNENILSGGIFKCCFFYDLWKTFYCFSEFVLGCA